MAHRVRLEVVHPDRREVVARRVRRGEALRDHLEVAHPDRREVVDRRVRRVEALRDHREVARPDRQEVADRRVRLEVAHSDRPGAVRRGRRAVVAAECRSWVPTPWSRFRRTLAPGGDRSQGPSPTGKRSGSGSRSTCD